MNNAMQAQSQPAPEFPEYGGPLLLQLPDTLAGLLDYAHSSAHPEIGFEVNREEVRTVLPFFFGSEKRIWSREAPQSDAIDEILVLAFGEGRTGCRHENESTTVIRTVRGNRHTYRVKIQSEPSDARGAFLRLSVLN